MKDREEAKFKNDIRNSIMDADNSLCHAVQIIGYASELFKQYRSKKGSETGFQGAYMLICDQLISDLAHALSTSKHLCGYANKWVYPDKS